MKLAEFDLLESKVTGLLRMHHELVSENRRLRSKMEELTRETTALRAQREQTEQIKKALMERLDRLIGE